MLKDILAIIEGEEGSACDLEAAIDFAELHQAHLGITVASKRFMVAAAFDPMGACWIDEDVERRHKREVAEVRARVAHALISTDVRGLFDEPEMLPSLVNIEGRHADVVLVGPPSSWSDARLRKRIIEAVLFGSGAPMLLHPRAWRPEPIERVVLGWNDSNQAAHAARALIAVAAPGAAIDVVTAGTAPTLAGPQAEASCDIARHLDRHGFKVEVHYLKSNDADAADLLQEFAHRNEAQLLAVGAFAHSRGRELMFGGVSIELIDACRLPVLMAH